MMIKSVSFFLLLCLACNTSVHTQTQPIIGTVSNGEIRWIQSPEGLKQQLASFVNLHSKIDLEYQEIGIKRQSSGYILIAVDPVANATTGVLLTEVDGNLYEHKDKGGTTITCEGCMSTGPRSQDECIPVANDYHVFMYCSDCSNGNCIKTITKNVEKLVFYETGRN